MGCCVSSGIQRENARTGPTSPPVEEETVKEVLSETRIVPKVEEGVKRSSPARKPESGLLAEKHGRPRSLSQERKVSTEAKPSEDILSESSEMFSYSESLSNAAAAPEKRSVDEEGGVVNQRPPPRKPRTPTPPRGSGERVQNRKRAVSSPERRGRPTPKASPTTGRGRSATGKTRNLADDREPRKDPGEGSARRSRTPGRRSDSVERRNATDAKGGASTAPPPNDIAAPAEESLENPVVSLECFIFL